MNAARLEKSDRLRKILRALKSRKKLSTRQIIEMTGCCAINSAISELRRNGQNIDCTRGNGAYWYSWRAKA